ncbi:MAG: hypothetical protein AB1716_04835 [Planctomycetota bacterium]
MMPTPSVRTVRLLAMAAAAAAFFAAPRASAQALVKMYRLTELRADGAGQSRAYAINDQGQAAGWVEVDEVRHSACWHNHTMTDLHGTVHFNLLHPRFNEDYSEAFDISNAGQVAGTARRTVKCDTEILVTNAYLLRPAVLTDLATPYPGDALANLGTLGNICFGAYDSAVTALSTYGTHIVGWADREDQVIRAFIVVPQQGMFYVDANEDGVNDLMVDLGSLSSQADPVSSATAVNELGQVTGYSYTPAGYHAFLVTPVDGAWYADVDENGVNDLMTDLGTLGGTNSWGRDINNAGVVVGESDFTTSAGEHYSRAFRWAAGAATDLGTLRADSGLGFSAASAVNENGAIVGWAENDNAERHAFIYENGAMLDLNSRLYLLNEDGRVVAPSLVLTEARDINEDGLIVGWGVIRGSATGETRGFLLTPMWVDPAVLAQHAEEAPVASIDQPSTAHVEYSSETDFGPPDDLKFGVAGETDEQAGPQTGPQRGAGFCGFGALGMLPLTTAGLCWMRVGRRRTAI